MGQIAKHKDTICGHLNSGNEVNAKIYTETLMNDENLVPCYDISSTMCDQIKGRLDAIAKFGPQKDMTQTFSTVIHVAPKMGVEELTKLRGQLQCLLGDEFVLRADEDKQVINPVIAENIDFKIPEDGQIVYRMLELAKERNINYTPSHDLAMALNLYIERTGKPHPLSDGGAPQQVVMPMPQYNPQPQQHNDGSGGMPPAGGPPAGPPGGGGGNFAIPAYQPQMNQPMPHPQETGYSMPSQPPMQPPVAPPDMGVPTYGMPVQPTMPGPTPSVNPPTMPTGPGQDKQEGGGIDDLEARLRALQ